MRSEKQTAASRANLAKYREKHPEGPGLQHGARSRHVRKRFGDLRTTEGARLRATLDRLRSEYAPLSAAQEILLDRLKEKLVSAACLGLYLGKQLTLVTESGELVPSARQAHALAESIRKDLEAIHEMASKRPTPSLTDYLNGRRAKA